MITDKKTMFELESKTFAPIEKIINLFTENEIRFRYCYDFKKEVYAIQYNEIDNEKVLDELENIAIEYKL